MPRTLVGFQQVASDIISVPELPRLNEIATMSLNGYDHTLYVRYVDAQDRSRIAEGRMTYECDGFMAYNHAWEHERVVVSPEQFPVDHLGREVKGYEDPTLQDWGNPFETPSRLQEPGVLCTQAYWKTEDKKSGVGANTVYVKPAMRSDADPTRVISAAQLTTILTPECVMADWHGDGEPMNLDMAKELEVYDPLEVGIFEIATSQGSRIATGRFLRKHQAYPLGDFRRFLDPVPGTWFDAHVSTAGAPFLVDGQLVMLVNGRDNQYNRWQTSWLTFDEKLQVRKVGVPFISPPNTSERGPGDQHIAFTSWCEYNGEHELLNVLWHLNDKTPCWSVCKPIFA